MREKAIAITILALLVIGGGVVVNIARSGRASLEASSENEQQATVKVGKKTFTAELALSVAQQAKGLSNRPTMQSDHGMLFVFTQPTQPPFWMKDVQFSIDIIWILRDKVVGVSRNLPVPKPGTPPQELPTFTPDSPVDYVLEVKAGQSKGIHVNDTVTISNWQTI